MQLVINHITISILKLLKKLETYYNQHLHSLKEFNKDNKLIINVYISGGSAMSFYIPTRATLGLDMEVKSNNKKILIPSLELNHADMILPNMQKLYIDSIFHPQFYIMSKDYISNSIPIDIFKYEKDNIVIIKPHILSPLDLILSKLTRWSATDQKDVYSLIENHFVIKEQLKDEIELVLASATIGYIDNANKLNNNINECFDMFQNVNSNNIMQNIKNNNKYKIIGYNLDVLKQTNLFDENLLETLF